MKKLLAMTLSALLLFFGSTGIAGMKGHGDSGGHEIDHSDHIGKSIHESEVDAYQLAYHLIDNKAQMEKMKDMKGMKMDGHAKDKMKSHHLMVYVLGPGGEKITDAKVGYLVTGPDGAEQKAMAMGMKGGFGADVDFHAGTHTVRTKIVHGDATVKDEFTYKHH